VPLCQTVAIGQTVAEIWRFFLFVQVGGRPPSWIWWHVWTNRKEHLVVFITVQNLIWIYVVVLTFCKLCLKTPIHAPKIGVLGQNRRRGGAMLTPNERVLTSGGCYFCASFGENWSRNATVRKAFADFAHLVPKIVAKWPSNSGVSGAIFWSKVHNSVHFAICCWMRVPRRKVSPISADWRLKLVAMSTSLSNRETNTRSNIYSHMPTNPENLVKIGLVGSEISLLQAIIKKDEAEKKKVTVVKHKSRSAFSLAS